MVRNRFRGTFLSSLAAAGLALFIASPLLAQQSTGKVQGRVVDEATGAPIAGASVTVVGTTIGNLTNDQGFYFLNEAPAGLQTVRAEFIGYRAVEISDERILAGQTTTLNFELSSSAVELDALVVQGERNPLVPRDQTSTKSIVQGETIDQLPLDNAASIVVLQPGVVETNSGRTIRGGRQNEEAVVINGMLTRGFGTGSADNISLPTNSLEQVDVNVGAFSAEFGEAQSGIVSFVTKSGGAALTGSLEYLTDQLSPDDMRTNFNRAELSLGGPIAGPLTFFVAGTLQGQDANATTDAPNRFVINGSDTCDIASICDGAGGRPSFGDPATFRLGRSSGTPGAQDFADFTAPSFVEWDNGRTVPFGWSQNDLFHGNLNWQLPRGSKINFSYNRNRDQNIGHSGFDSGGNFGNQGNFHFDGVDGGLGTRNSFALSWFQTITQSANQQLAFDFLAAYSLDRNTNGMLDQDWWRDNRDPFAAYSFENPEFAFDDPAFTTVMGFDVFDPSDEFIQAYRSNAIPADSLIIFPERSVGVSQTPTGMGRALRANPFGMETSFNLFNPGFTGISKSKEDRLQIRGSIDWQLGRFNRIKAGGEYFDVDLRAMSMPIGNQATIGVPEAAEPIKAGAFLQDRLDLGDLVLEAGVRWDYLDPKVQFTRVPGAVFNVPDSLKAGFVRLTENGFEPLPEPCNGAEICLNNFIDAETKSEFSPRIGASFPVTPTSTFRLSYGRFVQSPAFFSASSFFSRGADAAAAQVGFLQENNGDLGAGLNTNSTFGRDVDMPSTRTFEFGYRQLIGEDLVVDVSAFNKKQRDALASRKVPVLSPVTGATTFLNVVTNQDFTESNGFEVKIDKTVGNFVTSNLSYSFLDARGTGGDPFFFEDFIFRATTNLSALTGEPPNPPEVLLRLEQSRKHSLSWTGSLAFPADFQEGSVAGALLQDLGVFAIMRLRSGLPFTKLQNLGNGNVGPPSQGGNPESSISGAETPWTFGLDLRFTKGIPLGDNLNVQAFLDWRNPLDIVNNQTLFLETGTTVNAIHREQELAAILSDSDLDGDPDIDDFDIMGESPDTDFNKFMLLRTEQRFGNGDGIFTVEEQEEAFGQIYENDFGVNSRFERSDQLMRLGLRLAF